MCRMGYLRFDETVSQERRKEVVLKLAENSWKMGNRDGIGIVTWNLTSETVVKAMDLKEFKLPKAIFSNVFVHARAATCEKNIPNTHPMASDGTYLVHNGVVRITNEYKMVIKDRLTTTNDSEYILAAYLNEGRDMKKGLDKVSGWANVMAWDSIRRKLILFPEIKAYHIGRQAGILCVVQDWKEQTEGIIVGGLGRPYEAAMLKPGRIYELDGANLERSFDSELERSKNSSIEQKISSLPFGSDIECYGSTRYYRADDAPLRDGDDDDIYGLRYSSSRSGYVWARNKKGIMTGRFETIGSGKKSSDGEELRKYKEDSEE